MEKTYTTSIADNTDYAAKVAKIIKRANPHKSGEKGEAEIQTRQDQERKVKGNRRKEQRDMSDFLDDEIIECSHTQTYWGRQEEGGVLVSDGEWHVRVICEIEH